MVYHTTKNQFITVNGQKQAYREIGRVEKKTPLVMLVHLAATMDNWDPRLMDALAKEHRVIALDLPGVGASQGNVAITIPGMAQQAIEMIQALGFDKIYLLGLSMGGMIAQEIMRQEPALVEKLILVGTAPRGSVGVDVVTGTTFKYMFRAFVHGVDPKRYIFYTHDQRGKEAAEQVLSRLADRPVEAQDEKISLMSFLRQLRAIRKWGIADSDRLGYIQVPTLIVNGDHDQMVPTENSYMMHHKIKGSQLVIYSQAGHGSIFQYAEEFANKLTDFLSSE